MAWTVTLTEMLAELRSRGGYRRSTALTDGILTGFLNKGIARVHELVVKKYPEALVVSADLSPISGTSTVELPTTFYKLHLIALVDGDTLKPLPRISLRRSLSETNGYFLQGDNVQAMASSASFTVRVWYIPHATKLVTGTDEYDGVNGHEELVYEHALRMCKVRDRLPTNEHDEEIARLEKVVLTAYEAMDQAEPMYLESVAQTTEDDWS